MKKWYLWFVLSLLFAIGGLLNYLDGRSMIASIVQVSITAIFAFIQFFCDKKGEKGKKIFTYISAGTIILLIIWLIYLVYNILV